MVGAAILPSLLHQDPRYFYQGTGTTRSRLRHAILSAFIAKGDNGNWQPNYSSLGGNLASAALSNLYFPKSNRGVGLVFSQFALGTGERIGANLAQEFLLAKLTRRGRKKLKPWHHSQKNSRTAPYHLRPIRSTALKRRSAPQAPTRLGLRQS